MIVAASHRQVVTIVELCNKHDVVIIPFGGKGFAKLKKFQKSQKKTWIELTPTHPPPIQKKFGNPSLTWTEHSNHNN